MRGQFPLWLPMLSGAWCAFWRGDFIRTRSGSEKVWTRHTKPGILMHLDEAFMAPCEMRKWSSHCTCSACAIKKNTILGILLNYSWQIRHYPNHIFTILAPGQCINQCRPLVINVPMIWQKPLSVCLQCLERKTKLERARIYACLSIIGSWTQTVGPIGTREILSDALEWRKDDGVDHRAICINYYVSRCRRMSHCKYQSEQPVGQTNWRTSTKLGWQIAVISGCELLGLL